MNHSSRSIATAILAVASVALVGCKCKEKHNDKDHGDKMHHDASHGGGSRNRDMSGQNANASGGMRGGMNAMRDGRAAVARIMPSRAATTQPSMNNVRGTVTFTPEGDDAVRVTVELTGLPPNSTHGFHVHEKGDLSAPDLSSAGAHWDPTSTMHHGGPADDSKHAGDMGNLKSDSQGKAAMTMTLRGVSIDGTNPLVGKSIIVHAKMDDLKSQPSGDSGGRIAGGVIEMK